MNQQLWTPTHDPTKLVLPPWPLWVVTRDPDGMVHVGKRIPVKLTPSKPWPVKVRFVRTEPETANAA